MSLLGSIFEEGVFEHFHVILSLFSSFSISLPHIFRKQYNKHVLPTTPLVACWLCDCLKGDRYTLSVLTLQFHQMYYLSSAS